MEAFITNTHLHQTIQIIYIHTLYSTMKYIKMDECIKITPHSGGKGQRLLELLFASTQCKSMHGNVFLNTNLLL